MSFNFTFNKNDNYYKIIQAAIVNHSNGNFKLASKYYKIYLKKKPNDYKANFNLGSLLVYLKDYEGSILFLKKAEKIQKNNFAVYYNLGIIYYNLNLLDTSIKYFQKAINLNPKDFASLNNLGNIYKEKKKYKEALKLYKKSIKINSKNSYIFYNLGIVFHELGKHKESIKAYKSAIKLNPKDYIAYNNLGSVFNEIKKNNSAIKCFQNSLKIKPNNASALNGMSIVCQLRGEIKKSINFAKKAIKYEPNSILSRRLIANTNITRLKDSKEAINQSYKALKIHHRVTNFFNSSVSVTKLKHDVLQAKYISKQKLNINGIKEFIKTGEKILRKKINFLDKKNIDKKIILSLKEIKLLLPYYKKDYIYKPKFDLKNSLNPKLNWSEIERNYFNSSNKQIIYIDNFLSKETIVELRNFCLLSKVWNREHKNKYLGATCDRGFISDIHLNIAKDLKKFLPKIFGNRELQTFWAYKYEPKISKGINIHADSAKVNLNFWITPNEFNINKNSGGLRVYDEPAPKSWPFAKYNRNTEDIVNFLKQKKSKFVDIPHRYNRAVLFNSDYFHQTQEVNFKDRYEGRRINITYLFGSRNFYVPV